MDTGQPFVRLEIPDAEEFEGDSFTIPVPYAVLSGTTGDRTAHQHGCAVR